MNIYHRAVLLWSLTLVLGAALSSCSGSDSNSLDNTNQQSLGDDETAPPTLTTGNDNYIAYAGETRSVDNGIVDVIGESRGHYAVDFQISDGTYQVGFYNLLGILYSYWFAQNDTAMFSADLYSASTNELTKGTYEYVDIGEIRNGDTTLGRSVFSQTKVGIDFNRDGEVDDDEELDVVEGTLTISGNQLTRLVVSFDVLLIDGSRASGRYSAGFELVD